MELCVLNFQWFGQQVHNLPSELWGDRHLEQEEGGGDTHQLPFLLYLHMFWQPGICVHTCLCTVYCMSDNMQPVLRDLAIVTNLCPLWIVSFVDIFTLTFSPQKLFRGFLPVFTRMVLGWFPTIVVKIILVGCIISRSQCQKRYWKNNLYGTLQVVLCQSC